MSAGVLGLLLGAFTAGAAPTPLSEASATRFQPELEWRVTPLAATASVAREGDFTPSRTKLLNLGRRKGAVWIRSFWINDAQQPAQRVLHVGWPRLASVEAFAVHGDGRIQALGRSGWAVTWSDRAVWDPSHAFPLVFEPAEEIEVLLRIVSPTEVLVPIRVLRWSELNGLNHIGGSLTGAYGGMMFGLALYNVLVFLRVRRRYHLLYGASAFCFVPWWFMNAGWLGWLPGISQGKIYVASGILVAAWHFFRLELTREFLELGRLSPRFDHGLKWAARAVIPVFLALTLFLPPAIGESVGASLDGVLVGVTVLAGWIAHRRGSPMARWFIPASGLLFLGLFLGQAVFTGVAVHPMLAGLSIMGGTVAEMFVLTMALAERGRADAEGRALVLREAAAHRLSALEDLVAGVVHELNTPLGALRSSVDSVARVGKKVGEVYPDGAPGPLQRPLGLLPAVVQNAQQASFRIEAVVRALESFARLERPDREAVDLSVGLRSALLLLEAKIPKGVELEVDLPSLPEMDCRPAEIHQAFAAVVSNALEAMPAGGRLQIQAYPEQLDVVIRVRDEGVGIPTEERAHLFEPRLVRKGKRVKMGMGLSIARSVVEAHGGRIRVESEPGRGTEVVFRLPRTSTAHPTTAH